MVWQVSPACVNFLTVAPLVPRSSPRAPLTLVPIMPFVLTHQTIWAISVIASQGGKVRTLFFFFLCLLLLFDQESFKTLNLFIYQVSSAI